MPLGDYQSLKALDADHTAGMTPQEAAVALNAPTSYTKVAPFEAKDFLAHVSSESLAKIAMLPVFDSTIRPLLDAPDPKSADVIRRLGQWSRFLAGASVITVDEATSIAGVLAMTTTYNDGPSLAVSCVGWGLPVTADDVRAARSLS